MTFEEYATARLDQLLAAAWAICGDRALAEDLVQDVLLKIQARWDRIEALENRDGYVRTMLVNEHLSWRRKWSRVGPFRRPIEDGPESVPDHSAEYAERAAIAQALSGLPRQQRVVLALRYYERLTDTEIAEAMGCSPGTVRGYASRALATLRTRLDTMTHGSAEGISDV